MVITLFILVGILISLFLLTKQLTNTIFRIIYSVTKNRTLSIWILAILFLPGTFLHEGSHFISAMFLRVEAGEFSVIPSVENDGMIKAGHVMIARTDPFRHAIIGLAPLIIGLFLIYLIGYFFLPFIYNPWEGIPSWDSLSLYTIMGGYFLFMISTTMFSSKKDLESLIFAGPGLLLIIFILHLLGFRISFDISLLTYVSEKLTFLNRILLLTCIIDVGIFIFFWSTYQVIKKFRL